MTSTAEIPTSPLKDTATHLAAVRTDLGFERTRIAEDRTLMAVIRTALSLISFGFTIYKIIEGMQSSGMVVLREHAARNFAITLIVMGIVALVGGIIYYLQTTRTIARRQAKYAAQGLLDDPRPRSWITLLLAGGLILVGLFTLYAIVFGAGPFM